MAPHKPRCTFKECKSAAQRIVGDCGFCDGHYCAKHRLLEDHKCSGLEDVSMNPTLASEGGGGGVVGGGSNDAMQWWLVGLADVLGDIGLPLSPGCKKESHERNAAQLEAERTQVIRGV
ncbi:hypothetical protein F4779DRAFT_617169 [Xylariaceae sp. FL0662B]|nr:hypothetical protein F4779DRAFT_617169 [Xylariaceae sp. FL0662B]